MRPKENERLMWWRMKEAGVSKTDNVMSRWAASAEQNAGQCSEQHNGTTHLAIVWKINPLSANCGDLQSLCRGLSASKKYKSGKMKHSVQRLPPQKFAAKSRAVAQPYP